MAGYDFDLRVQTARDGVARVTVRGELDMAVADVLVTAVAGALRTGGIRLVEVELSGVHFLDAAAVSALLAARNRAHAVAKEFRIRGMRGLPLRVLEITGVLDLLCGKQPEEAG